MPVLAEMSSSTRGLVKPQAHTPKQTDSQRSIGMDRAAAPSDAGQTAWRRSAQVSVRESDYGGEDDGSFVSAQPAVRDDARRALPPISGNVFELAKTAGADAVMQAIEDGGLDINAVYAGDDGRPTLLHIAAGFGKTDLLGRLIEAGADVHALDARGATPLFHAARYDHRAAAEQLYFDGGCALDSVNARGATVLHVAARYENASVLGALVGEEGAPLDVEDANGLTPLLCALTHSARTCAKLLIEAGADLNACLADGQSALHVASRRGMQAAVEALLARDALELDAPDSMGATALAHAARRGHLYVVESLLEAGANVSLADSHGWTPLHWAARLGHAAVVAALVNGGADSHAQNNDGKTPADVASAAEAVAPALKGVYEATPQRGSASRTPSRTRSQAGSIKSASSAHSTTFVTQVRKA